MAGVGIERLVSETCDGCARSKPGRKRDCEVKRAIVHPERANPSFAEWATDVFAGGRCRFRQQRQ